MLGRGSAGAARAVGGCGEAGVGSAHVAQQGQGLRRQHAGVGVGGAGTHEEALGHLQVTGHSRRPKKPCCAGQGQIPWACDHPQQPHLQHSHRAPVSVVHRGRSLPRLAQPDGAQCIFGSAAQRARRARALLACSLTGGCGHSTSGRRGGRRLQEGKHLCPPRSFDAAWRCGAAIPGEQALTRGLAPSTCCWPR